MNHTSSDAIEKDRDRFVERLLKSTAGAFDIFTIYLGDRLGFYRALSAHGPITSEELASHTGTYERYVREWLEQQTVAGILKVEDEAAAARSRRYRLPAGHREVLVDRDSLNYLAPLAQMVAGAVRPMHQVLKAYRSGKGVPYPYYGAEFREGQAAMNRTMFLRQLGTEWLPSIPDVHRRLMADPPARVADIGCGGGWSGIGMAQAYPKVQVDGYDLDEASVELARGNVADAGLEERVRIHHRDAADPSLRGRYDLVTAFECVHDMADPVGALRTMLSLARDGGSVMVMDERVGDRFTARGNEVEWMMYGWSVLHCLPVGKADGPSVETGTVMRPETLKQYAAEAGFCDTEILPIDNFFFRFYRLKVLCR
ncbi:MAG: methyltransferase domain-containing protein [Desulfobacterales bacterium]|jgi:SAM-dependent methyltransferase|nr:methyltransferase domain-containing protein [Desulfobacterales bacterium]